MLVPRRLVGDERSAETVRMPVRFDISLYTDIPRVDVRLWFDNTAFVYSIAPEAFSGSDIINIYGYAGSSAAAFVAAHPEFTFIETMTHG